MILQNAYSHRCFDMLGLLSRPHIDLTSESDEILTQVFFLNFFGEKPKTANIFLYLCTKISLE